MLNHDNGENLKNQMRRDNGKVCESKRNTVATKNVTVYLSSSTKILHIVFATWDFRSDIKLLDDTKFNVLAPNKRYICEYNLKQRSLNLFHSRLHFARENFTVDFYGRKKRADFSIVNDEDVVLR